MALFKFEKIIRIPGKSSFSELSILEVALMIEADSAISPEGNEAFNSCALDEFLYCGKFDNRPDLEQIRADILENIYIHVKGRSDKEINTEYLLEYANKLRNQNEDAI